MYFPYLVQIRGKHWPEKTLYLETFHVVTATKKKAKYAAAKSITANNHIYLLILFYVERNFIDYIIKIKVNKKL